MRRGWHRTYDASKSWSELGRWHINLADILNGRYGRKRGFYVYIIRYRDDVLYVGMTRDTIFTRLQRHIKDHSNIGACIKLSRDLTHWSVEVIKVTGNLDFAEKQHIWKYKPHLNERDNNRIVVDTKRIKSFFRNPNHANMRLIEHLLIDM